MKFWLEKNGERVLPVLVCDGDECDGDECGLKYVARVVDAVARDLGVKETWE